MALIRNVQNSSFLFISLPLHSHSSPKIETINSNNESVLSGSNVARRGRVHSSSLLQEQTSVPLATEIEKIETLANPILPSNLASEMDMCVYLINN